MKVAHLRLFALLAALTAAAALAWLLATPSEAGSAVLWGYSAARLGLAGVLLAVALTCTALSGMALFRRGLAKRLAFALEKALSRPNTLLTALLCLACGVVFFSGATLFTWLFIPAPLRPLLAWMGLTCTVGLIIMVSACRARLRGGDTWAPLGMLWPRGKNLDSRQRKVLYLLLGLGAVYFFLFIPPNLRHAEDPHIFMMEGGDEYITYPYVVEMLSPRGDFSATLYSVFIYEDYHYGYPFYLASALAMLPARLVEGADFASHTRVNLLILRQMVSVLPIILAALVLVYAQTRFRSRLGAAALFLFLLTLPAVVGGNIIFWHPDALVVLAAALTLYYLQRDDLRLGGNFYAAAAFCGMASAIKFYGFFFFLAIALYLILTRVRGRHNLRRIALAGVFFIMVMSAVIVFSNPFLFFAPARQRFVEILHEKSAEMTAGYASAAGEDIYHTGFLAWLPFLEKFFASRWFLLFGLASLAVAAWRGRERLFNALILAWVLPMAAYLVFFVAVKSVHYWLPALLPFFSGTLVLASLPAPPAEEQPARVSTLHFLLPWVAYLFIAIQLAINLRLSAALWVAGL